MSLGLEPMVVCMYMFNGFHGDCHGMKQIHTQRVSILLPRARKYCWTFQSIVNTDCVRVPSNPNVHMGPSLHVIKFEH
jgi:hypothetical protein